MLTHRLLVPGVYLLGAFLIVIGLLAIAVGVPIVRMEIGWTEVVGGSVAASSGCVILALGVLAAQLDAIRQSFVYAAAEEPFAGAGQPVALAEEPVAESADDTFADAEPATPAAPEPEPHRTSHPLAPQRWTPVASPVRPEPPLAAAPLVDIAPPAPQTSTETDHAAPTLDEGAPALLHAEEEASHSPSVLPPDPVVDPVADLPPPPPAKPKPNFLSSFLARRGIDPTAPAPAPTAERLPFDTDLPGPAHQPARTPIDLSSGWDDEAREDLAAKEPAGAEGHAVPVETPLEHPDQAALPVESEQAVAPQAEPQPEPEPETKPEPEPDPLQPVVVGRYNAGTASYVMYSNGMIEVETEQGTHQFGSMQELKSFIEKRDARVS